MSTLPPVEPLPAQRPPRRLGARGRAWFDRLLVVALLLPVAAAGYAYEGVHLVLTTAQVLPLLGRRRHPVAVFWLVVALHALQVLLVDEPLPGQLAYPVAVYSVARFAAPAQGWAALAASACAAAVASYDWTHTVDTSLRTVAANALFIGAIVAAAWALGTLGRTRQAYVDALVERGHRLEREAAQQVALAAADERARIAREMHDVVAHGLSVIVVQADGARYAARTDPAIAVDTLGTVAATGREALTEMRRLLGLLRQEDGDEGGPALRPQPGLGDLDALVAEARSAGARVAARLPEPGTRVPDGVGLTAYRVVQEALTNVRKHAGPDPTVAVAVAVTEGVIELSVEDDGRGAAAAPDGHGLGLVGMRERVASHGGTVEAGPRPGGGFGVSARIPT